MVASFLLQRGGRIQIEGVAEQGYASSIQEASMPLTRLLAVVMLVSFGAGQLLAQSQQNKISRAVESQATEPTKASKDAGLEQSDLSSQIRLHKSTTELQAPFDATCYAIRSYLVIRDSPHSDTTHRDGSTTCVPAARIRMYSTVDQER